MSKSTLDLDNIDYIILYELEQDCRRSIREIAEKAKITKRMAEYRIGRLIKKGVILGYTTIFNNSKLGFVNHDVWIQMGDATPAQKALFLETLIKNKHIAWVASCGGKFDYAISVLSEDTITFSEMLDSILEKFSDIVANYSINITTRFYNYPRSHLIENGLNQRRVKSLSSGIPKKADLSLLDIQILSLLSNDAKISATDIAIKTKISSNTARTRLERLEKEGIIQGYRAILLSRALGFRTYEVFIDFGYISPAKRKELEAFCLGNQYITYLLSTIGNWNVDIAFDSKSSDHFQELLKELRSKFGSMIKDYEYVPIMEIHKSNYTPFLK